MSTYSPNLRIELIANGDQVGYWGDTTNNNLGTLIEQAIAGYQSITITAASQALVALDGIADEARNQCLMITTTLSTPCTLYIPPADKTYTFYNSTSFSATIAAATTPNGLTPTGGVTYTIPATSIVQVWCNGTDVLPSSTYFPLLTVGTLSSYTTGDILVASSGTTVARLPDVATGNVLLSGGVATPPGYGKVGLTTHVSGTLAPTNGGTGLSTATTGDLLYASGTNTWASLADVATGNALISGGVGVAPSWGKIGLATARRWYLGFDSNKWWYGYFCWYDGSSVSVRQRFACHNQRNACSFLFRHRFTDC